MAACIKQLKRYVRWVKKRLAMRSLLFLLTSMMLCACATSQDSMSNSSVSETAASGAPVPGEKLNDEGSFTPGGPGASGSVHW
jgi:hypothetical protein